MLVGERYASLARNLRETLKDELTILAGQARDQRADGRQLPSRKTFTTVLCCRNLIDESGDPFLQFNAVSGHRDFLSRLRLRSLRSRTANNRKRSGYNQDFQLEANCYRAAVELVLTGESGGRGSSSAMVAARSAGSVLEGAGAPAPGGRGARA